MQVYDHPTFRMACQQFDLVADYLEIPQSDRARLKYPKRSMTVALPIHCDDGSIKVFSGYRVQLPRRDLTSRRSSRRHGDDQTIQGFV